MDKMFKVSAIAVAIMAGSAPAAFAADNGFVDDSTLGGAFYVMSRDRDRTTATEDLANQLDHTTLQASLDFSSGYAADIIGLDLGVFGAYDLQTGTNGEGSEFIFIENGEAEDGISFYKAAIKAKFGEQVTAKAGYFQPSVPSALGVNWGFLPGTYLGAELGYSTETMQLGAVIATEYKSPWVKDMAEFVDSSGEDAGSIYSLGLRTDIAGVGVDFGYGASSDGDRSIYHVKSGWAADGLSIKGQLYAVDDDEVYESTAYQAALLSSFAQGQYSFRVEATYTIADQTDRSSAGNFAYRVDPRYGQNNGAYDVWWNNRSDFNHDGETAIFGSISRDMGDKEGLEGLSIGASIAHGFGSEAQGFEELQETGYSAFANYSTGWANFGAHFTVYESNVTADWGAGGYSNAFMDERDFKLTMSIPFSL